MKIKHLYILLLILCSSEVFADFRVNQTLVTGVTQLSEAEVRKVIEPHLQGTPSEIDFIIAAKVLTQALHDAGAFVAKVYVEKDEQDLVVLRAIEGLLANDGISLDQSSNRINDKVIIHQLESILQPGSIITADKYERAILLTNDLPGVGGSVATILPAEKVGEARFELFPAEESLLVGHAHADNFGSEFTGRYRLGSSIDINSPMLIGDKISLGANISDEGTLFVYADGSLPIFLPGLRAGLTINALDYKTNQPQHLRGNSQQISAYLHYPFIRSRLSNLYGEIRLGRHYMLDEDNISTITDRVVDTSNFKLYGDRSDSFFGGGISKFNLDLVVGNVDLSGFAPYKLEDAQTAKTAGGFSRLAWNVSRMQQILGPWQSYIEVAGQFASKRMDASQSLGFGGPYDFAGYHSGILLGDKGWRIHTDIRYNVANPWFGGQQQWSLFYDYGRITTHAKSVIAGIITPGIDNESYTIQSTGLAFSQQLQSYQVQGVIAWRVNNELSDRILEDSNDSMIGWLNLVYNF